MDIRICHDCKYAIFHSEDPGFSPKECDLPSRCITYLDGCKKNLILNVIGGIYIAESEKA